MLAVWEQISSYLEVGPLSQLNQVSTIILFLKIMLKLRWGRTKESNGLGSLWEFSAAIIPRLHSLQPGFQTESSACILLRKSSQEQLGYLCVSPLLHDLQTPVVYYLTCYNLFPIRIALWPKFTVKYLILQRIFTASFWAGMHSLVKSWQWREVMRQIFNSLV